MLRNNSKQSAESMWCILKKKKGRAAVRRICRKGRFQAWNEKSERTMEYQIIVSMTVGIVT